MAVLVLDVNIILRYLLDDYPDHSQEAAEVMMRVKEGVEEAFIPESVVAESVFVLLSYYRAPRSEIARWLIEILKYRGLTGDRSDLVCDALALFAESGISIVDALTLLHSEQNGHQIATFDKKLARLAAKRRSHR